MANFANLFKEEIRRLARKEVKEATSKLKSETSGLRRTIISLKRRLGQLEAANKKLARAAKSRGHEEDSADATPPVRARFSGEGILKLRRKLGLTQAEFAALVGVSGQSVYQWERKGGRLLLRTATKNALLEIRGLGAREARKRLEEMGK